jgi:hypothetical protein
MSVDAKWLKDHVLMIGSYTLILLEVYVGMVNLRLGGARRGKRRTIGWEGGESEMESRHLQGYSLCLCRLRTDELAPRE